MKDHAKKFISETHAMKYAVRLEKIGCEDVVVSSAKDGFGQTVYRVEWNDPEERSE